MIEYRVKIGNVTVGVDSGAHSTMRVATQLRDINLGLPERGDGPKSSSEEPTPYSTGNFRPAAVVE